MRLDSSREALTAAARVDNTALERAASSAPRIAAAVRSRRARNVGSSLASAQGDVARPVAAAATPRDFSAFDLSGRRALVTGSTRGIGLGLARALLDAGAMVVLHGRDAGQVAAIVDRLARETGRIDQLDGIAFDVTDAGAMRDAIDGLEQRLGGIDVLVNNAGIGYSGSLIDVPLDDWNRVISTDLTSCLALAQRVVPGMLERREGKIINICSVFNRLGRDRVGPYAAAKAGLGALTQVMCANWAASGIQVNAIAPGFIATEMTTKLQSDEEFDLWLRKRVPASRWGRVEDLGGIAVFLASHAADFVNGQVIFVDGGLPAVL